jgi:hypothetical protein
MRSYSSNQIPVNDDKFLQKHCHLKDEHFVEEVYKTYLKINQPKQKDKNMYIKQLKESNLTREQLLKLIRGLPEFKQLWNIEDTNGQFKLTDAAFLQKTFIMKVENFVREAYCTYLKREPDEEGRNRYIKEIQNNVITREQFLVTIRKSQEFKLVWNITKVESSIDGEEDDKNTDSREVQTNAEELSSECFLTDSGILNAYLATLQNTNPKNINDQEFIDFTSKISDQDFLQCVYKIYLHRDIDSIGLAGWSEYLMNDRFRRALFLKDFRRSAEFQSKWNSTIDNLKADLTQRVRKCKDKYSNAIYKFLGQ